MLYQLMTKQLKILKTWLASESEITLTIDDVTQVVTGWELLEDGPAWVLDVQTVPAGRWFHAGETLSILIPGPQTVLEGRVVAVNSTPDSQRLVIKGLGSTYVSAP